MSEIRVCPACKSNICNPCGSVKCQGTCGKYFHIQCIKLTRTSLSLIQSCPNISWKCTNCCELPRLEAIEKLNQIGCNICKLKKEFQIIKTIQAKDNSFEYFDVENLNTLCPCHCISEASPEIKQFLEKINEWSFDVFAFYDITNGNPIKYIGCELMKRYNLINKFKILPTALVSFLNQLDKQYSYQINTYHNSKHGTDVAQSVHYLIDETGVKKVLSDIEIFALIIGALVHDYNHTGTTNSFHIMTKSPLSILYNDISVLENHHVSSFFRLLKEHVNCNILANLTTDEYQQFRKIVIDIILRTDLALHDKFFMSFKINKSFTRSELLALLLQTADIGNCAKDWTLCYRWTNLLIDEFFRQGDIENLLGLPYSIFRDRNTTNVAELEIKFIDDIGIPTFELCCLAIETFLKGETLESNEFQRPWVAEFERNKIKWKQISNEARKN